MVLSWWLTIWFAGLVTVPVKMLLNRGANIHAEDDALGWAAAKGPYRSG